MKTIIITGGIGSGKSTISNILRDLGVVVIEADKVGHEITDPFTAGWQEVVNAFGQDILTPQQTIDRKKLAEKVFDNPEALHKLNQILHPKINAEIGVRLDKQREKGAFAAAVETALIPQADWFDQADFIWVIKVAQETALKRLEARGLSRSESLSRMAFQPPAEKKISSKLVIITNDGTPDDLRNKVKTLWREMDNV